MPGPDPRTRSTATGTKRMGDPLRQGKKGTSTKDPSKEDRETGEKKLPKEPEKQPEAPIGALGNKKKALRISAAQQAKEAEDIVRAAVRDKGKDMGRKKPKLKQPSPAGSIDRKQGLGRIIDGKFYPAMAKGGRAMYKSGMRVCKLAKRGKGRAYGKNS